MKPVVRQMRGPGMNKGLKKPRHGHIKKPEPIGKQSRAAAGATPGNPSRNDYSKKTYLSSNVWK